MAKHTEPKLPFAAYSGQEPFIFVSYAHGDAAKVFAELSWIKKQGFNVWYDEGISPAIVGMMNWPIASIPALYLSLSFLPLP
ncbi:MAG: hypothetical protein QGG67_18665 [Gammaproteobacteria bacterium]|jgi:hypothetical protein|nr:hypothetical protein [Gammaproteobacteria bacterium]MDP6097987.1 hypothetical protein [Gammaproteobacteria bacterium]MDP7455398.1 hypothetical protein [Gammaproteobacteria bacterium]HJO11036.1 hypothetical protein [Gammaproteobacteria bacterium]|tara:strand:+ start:904 stop:1149 length:246 start_codon:yes stop_codon:yes gene_type:complete